MAHLAAFKGILGHLFNLSPNYIVLSDVIKDIKSIKIQGAEAIARAGLQALGNEVKRSRNEGNALIDEMRAVSKKLLSARPTEPMLRNLLCETIYNAQTKGRKELIEFFPAKLDELEEDRKRIVEFASRRLSGARVVFTHCHSSTVTESIIGAWVKRVICTETRPRYQGHKTAREIAGAGIPVTMIVDSASRTMMKQADLIIIGADAITSHGAVVNKIGSGMIASIAKELRKPLFVATSSYKFDPLTVEGYIEPIEERDPREVLAKKIKGVRVVNPAFEAVSPDRIDSIITEFGIIHPSDITNLMRGKKPWLFKVKI